LRRPIELARRIVEKYQFIVIGDVSSLKLAKTRMAKSVLDAGWGMLKTQLQYKGEDAGRCVRIVNERYTTQECSSCKARTGPAGLDSLVVRSWTCSGCGITHDRDVNAAVNVLFVGRCSPSVSGNEPSLSAQSPSPTNGRHEARISALKAAA
jgi:putative transposase